MGHIINPINLRVGVSKYWTSTWALSHLKNSYSYMLNQDVFIQNVFWGLFNRRFGYLGPTFKSLLPGSIRIIRSGNRITLLCDLYYTQSLLTKYLLFYYFNNLFSLKNLNKVAARRKLVLSKADFVLFQQFKPTFLKWAWLAVINPANQKFWTSLNNVLTILFRPLFPTNTVLTVKTRALNNNTITAEFLARFISVRLQQGTSVRKLLKLIKTALSHLVDKNFLLGYHIKLSGRFSRIQQASCSVTSAGVLARNEATSNVDYAFSTANLKFSTCGVKVLLARPSNVSANDAHSILLKNEGMTKWFNYLPKATYSRWERGKISKILAKTGSASSLSSKDLNKLDLFLYN